MTQTLITLLVLAGIFAAVLAVVGLCTLLLFLLLWPFERFATAAGLHRVFLACRFLRSHMIVTWSIAGVAIGIMVMTIVTSVMSGFSKDIQERIRGTQAHLIVKPLGSMKILEYEGLVDEIRRIPRVVGAAPRIEYFAIVGYRDRHENVTILGIDPAEEASWDDLAGYFEQGDKQRFDFRYDERTPRLDWASRFSRRNPDSDDGKFSLGLGKQVLPGIVVGQELLKWPMTRETYDLLFRGMDVPFTDLETHVEVPMLETSVISMWSARPERQNPIAIGSFEVVGHLHTGMSEFDATYVLMDLGAAQQFLGMRGQVNTIAIQVENYERDIEPVREEVRRILRERDLLFDPEDPLSRGYCVTYTWKEVKAVFLQAVQMEKALQLIILFCIVIVAGFNIVAIYTLMVRSKTRDVGILRSLGTGRRGIAAIFLWSGLLCGLFGSLIGALLGLAVSYNLNPVRDFLRDHFDLDPFPRSIYYLDRIPADVDLRTIGLVVVMTMIVGLVFSIYPAWRASRLDPIEAIRYE